MNEYAKWLPIDERRFKTVRKGNWIAEVKQWPIESAYDSGLWVYVIHFKRLDGSGERSLTLSVQSAHLKVQNRQQEVIERVSEWLESQDGDGEMNI